MSVQTQMIQTIAAGTDILCEGYCSKHVFVLLQGKVRVSRRDEDGNPITLAELEPGEVFGEMGLISNLPCSATVTAITEVKVRSLDKEQFFYAMSNNIKSVEQVLGTLFKRMRQMNARVIELEGKLAACESMPQAQQAPSQQISPHMQGMVTLSGLTPQATHALGGLEAFHIEKFPFLIGRHISKKKTSWFTSKDNDLAIHDIPPYGISKQHCRLDKKKNQVFITDTSRVGTWLDDERIDGKTRIEPGVHTLSLGSSYSVFSFELRVYDD